MYTYTIIFNEQPLTQNSNDAAHTHTHTLPCRIATTTRFGTGSQKQTALSVANSPLRSSLNLTSTHQMASPNKYQIQALLLINQPRNDERLS